MSEMGKPPAGPSENPDLEHAVSAIVAASATISERMAAPETLNSNAASWPTPLQDDAITQWHSALSHGGNSYLAQRLEYEELTRESVQGLLSTPRPVPKSAWPSWAHCLLEAFEHSHPDAPAWDTDTQNEQTDIPFAQFVTPLVAWADIKLAQCFKDLSEHLSDESISQFQRQLRLDLSDLVAPTLVAEFQIAKFRLLRGQPAMPGSTHAYNRFVAELRNGGSIQLFEKYPVLARLIGTHLVHWISFVSEFCQRLGDDRDLLQDRLAWSRGTKARSVGFGLSDKHGNGRTCIKLTLTEGGSIFYKPKSLTVDLIYSDALALLTDLMDTPTIEMPVTLNRGSYGWVEGVEHRSCQTQAELDAFHRNSGIVLFVQYLYGGSDLHFENLIARGPNPVVVDHECLMTHLPALGADGGDAANLADTSEARDYLNSVLRVHMLPFWKPFRDLGVSDVSALGSTTHTRGEQPVTRLRFPNTDLMRYATAQSATQLSQTNLPAADGPLAQQGMDWKAQLKQLIDGFTQAYQSYAQAEHGGSETAKKLAERLEQASHRYIFRDTASYGKLLNKLLQPKSLKSGVHAQIALEGLWRAALMETDETMDMCQFVPTEMAQLMNLDIPVFFHRADSCDVTTHPNFDGAFRARNYLKFPASILLADRQKQLGKGDLKLQNSYIRSSFEARYRGKAAADEHQSDQHSKSSQETDNLSAYSFRTAREIADAIIAQAIEHPGGASRWNGVHFDQQQGSWQTGALPPCLYDGNVGIGLFLAAMARASGQERYKQAATAALLDFTDHHLRPATLVKSRQAGRGIGKGLGSVVYALLTAKELLNDGNLQSSAEAFADELCAQDCSPGCPTDVLSGAAGEIIALAALHRQDPNDKWVDAIGKRADHILRNADGDADRAGWLAGRTGLVHGLGGIANALLIAHAFTGQERYYALAANALHNEDEKIISGLLDEETGNGPKCAWCNGLPGIAAARLALGNFGFDLTKQNQRTLEAAVAGLVSQSSCASCEDDDQANELDHACCGTAGKLAVLQSAQDITPSNKLDLAQNALNRKLIDQWDKTGGFNMGWGPYRAIPTFHQGMAGVGYQLLRNTNITHLPDVMLFH